VGDVVVVGIGNGQRRDDGVGPEVLRRLGPSTGARMLCLGSDSMPLLLTLQGVSSMIVVDAVATGSRPGTLHCWDAAEGLPPEGAFSLSTHTPNVVQILEMARALGRLPPSVRIYAIEVGDTGFGTGLSPPVEHAVAELAERLRQELKRQ
jgi:hydrogenase maturation protease